MSPTSRPRSSASRATCRLPKNPRASAWFSRTTPTCASSVTDWTIATLGREIAARQVSPVAVTREYFTSEHECTAVCRLRDGGAVTLGKLNMTELALGPFGDNAHHGDVQNPWRPGHVAGGSSSGSAAAVAAGFVLGTLGSDTGGSIRLPAACCGVVGLKPTYGRVSRAGVMPLSWSMDHLGPLTRTVADTALLLEIVAGHDPRDPTSSRRGVPYYQRMLESPVAGLRVGIPENYYFDGIDAEMDAAVRGAADVLAGLDVLVTPVRVPDPRTLTDSGNV